MNRTKEGMSLKAKINNYAKASNIPAQTVLQNFMFEHFLERLSKSDYKDMFIIKGGMLVSNLVGLATRSTKDLDVTLKNLSLDEATILNAVNIISKVDIGDDIEFSDFTFVPIRPDDEYGGFRVKFNAKYFLIITPLSIDISAGDKITPNPLEYEFSSIFESDRIFKLWGYNIETVLAEKVQTIISRGVASTRPRDFYDVYILVKDKPFNTEYFRKAFAETCIHRGTENFIKEPVFRLSEIEQSKVLQELWQKYAKQFPYAKEITYKNLMKSLKILLDLLEEK